MVRWLTRVSWLGALFLVILSLPVQDDSVAAQEVLPFGASDPDIGSWDIRAGNAWLRRSFPGSAPLVKNYSTGATLIDAADHEFDFEPGPDLTIRHHGEVWGLEFRWFQVHDWISETPTISAPARITLPFRAPVDLWTTGSSLSSRYVSELDNFELNLRKELCPWLTALVGFRFIELNEDLGVLGSGGSFTGNGTLQTFNDLYGCQLGLDAILWNRGGPFRVEGFGKAGVYGNDARSRTYLFQASGNSMSDSASKTHTSFLGETGVQGVYQFNPHFAARLGYQLTWIDGVAVASSQMAQLDPAHTTGTSSTVATAGDTVFYHGGVGSLEFHW